MLKLTQAKNTGRFKNGTLGTKLNINHPNRHTHTHTHSRMGRTVTHTEAHNPLWHATIYSENVYIPVEIIRQYDTIDFSQ